MVSHISLPYHEFLPRCMRLAGGKNSFWADSDASQHGRYSFICTDPYRIIKDEKDIFQTLKTSLPHQDFPIDFPFKGGFAGFLGYDLCEITEDCTPPSQTLLPTFPNTYGGFYDCVLYADHHTHKAGLFAVPTHPADDTQTRLDYILTLSTPNQIPVYNHHITPAPLISPQEYCKLIEQTIEYICAGDIFQANIAQHFKAHRPSDFDPLRFYLHLRNVNPAPFACFMNFEHDFSLMSASPERFLKIQDNLIEARPIKGTLSSDYPSENLLNSAKDRSENIMIVDLLRNDIAKYAVTGSVAVPELCVIETYKGLHHLVSSITAKKPESVHPVDVLKGAFPGGSITGAPKKRAIEIIYELEGYKRGAYCGTAGYISHDGTMDMNILIRTVTCDKDNIVFSAGGGITASSDPIQELEETHVKAKKIMEALDGDITKYSLSP